uniref:Transforming acidic coiled-coil containing protein 1 n=1 Tax=Canis lupus familiaris TaxID=9615 RepID=A0A8I3NES2_CANLF
MFTLQSKLRINSKTNHQSSDSEGNFETPEAETPIRSPLKESRDSSLGLAGPEAKTQESQEVDEQLVAEVVEKCSSETCSRTSENEVAQQAVDSYLVKDFKEEPEHDSSRISVVRPFSIEAKNSTNIPAALGTRAAYGCVTVVSGEASPSSIPEAILDKAMTEGTMGVTLETSTESDLKAGSSSPEPVPSRSKLRKPKPVPLRKKTIGEFLETDIALEGTPLPQASYQFCPDEMDGNTSSLLEGARIQKSPPDTKEASSTPSSDTNDSGVELLEESRNSPLKLEFDFTEDVENIESRKGLPRKVGRKLGSKLPPKVQKDSINKPVGAKGVDQPADPAADSAPPSQASAKLDPSQWDSPNFNPFGGHSTLQNSPLLSSKGSYHFDESMDPFKPTTTLASSDFCSPAGNHINEILESPKKAKSRLITSGCKVKKYETQSLALDGCSQDEGAVISQISDISNRDGHATDEEKLASTSSGQKSAGAEVKGIEKEMCQKMEKDGSAMTGLLESSMEKAPVSVACEGESPLDGICLSESDKTAVLTLIREEIITKEIEANEWKKKYEETRQEVLEMRKGSSKL